MPAPVITMARNLAFYGLFYLGSVFYVLASLAMSPFGPGPLSVPARGWSRYHRACMAVFLGIRFVVRGAPVPGGGTLVAMKHESFAEAIDLPALLGNPIVFAKAELLRIPLWGRVARNFGLIAVERDQGARAMRTMISAARAWQASGRPFMIFPEGTRIAHGKQPDLEAGFAGLYKLLGLPVVPIAIDSGPLYHRRWKRPGTITMLIGETIPPGLPRAEIEARVRSAINALNTGPVA
jgi:1-acyl-sn-glycerol-3-phosphate acyltransferase